MMARFACLTLNKVTLNNCLDLSDLAIYRSKEGDGRRSLSELQHR